VTDRPLVIGVGNRMRRDDGAGPAVLDALAGEGFQTAEVPGDCARLIDLWEGRGAVHVVDAMRSEQATGAVLRFDAIRETIPRGRFLHTSHAFGVAEAVETARLLGRLPGRLILWGVEGEDFGPGDGLSPAVAAAVADVAARVAVDLRGNGAG
jgi:hydrogenase maturation protease